MCRICSPYASLACKLGKNKEIVMGGFFGVASKSDCVTDLFYGTDYHSHLGTRRGGLAVSTEHGFEKFIHDITNAQFRSKLEADLPRLAGNRGIGVISDYEDQPLIIGSRLGRFAIVTVGVVQNLEALAEEAFVSRSAHFSEMTREDINTTEHVAAMNAQEDSFEEAIQ
ncbi:MAG: hypothetical protein HQ559_02255, partial [Lentisphaerae bacterium]|nr:hypothetical protein [Lentisphaerota bacterium]